MKCFGVAYQSKTHNRNITMNIKTIPMRDNRREKDTSMDKCSNEQMLQYTEVWRLCLSWTRGFLSARAVRVAEGAGALETQAVLDSSAETTLLLTSICREQAQRTQLSISRTLQPQEAKSLASYPELEWRCSSLTPAFSLQHHIRPSSKTPGFFSARAVLSSLQRCWRILQVVVYSSQEIHTHRAPHGYAFCSSNAKASTQFRGARRMGMDCTQPPGRNNDMINTVH